MRPRTRKEGIARRHMRLRQKIRGTAERPRMAVCMTGRHIYVQFVDDTVGRTLAAVSTLGIKGLKPTVEGARQLGLLAAQRAKEKNIETVVFDRGGFRYHGRVKALADAAREAGLKF
ncbi:MAG: 50S ribosomal protein L18 [Verrucomicrobiae bacterium]|nr:50S ribosomal protein L18 [Verrucomicrobiae bacterium]MDW8344556.1 50S ribosomal protein L18 [Verrucomicrobiae bacterium]